MFEALLKKYKVKTDVYLEQIGGYATRKTDVERRKLVQDVLIKDYTDRAAKARDTLKQKQFAQRVELFKKQLKFTQGMQELKLQKEELEFMLKEVEGAKIKLNDKELLEVNATLKQVNENIRALEREKQVSILQVAKNVTKSITLPTKDEEFKNPDVMRNALAVQHALALEMTLDSDKTVNVYAGFEKSAQLDLAGASSLNGHLKKQSEMIENVRKLLVGNSLMDETKHGLPLFGSKTFGERGKEQSAAVSKMINDLAPIGKYLSAKPPAPKPENYDAAQLKVVGEIKASTALTLQLVADVQQAIETLLARELKAKEMEGRDKQCFGLVSRYLGRDPGTSKALTAILKTPEGGALRLCFVGCKDFGEVAAKIQKEKAADRLSQVLEKIKLFAMNDVVQGPFLLNKDNHLVQKPRNGEDDQDFFANTNSAQGDYNDPKNLGKYTYHVTALGNILRAVDSGISLQGLSPGRGGQVGGSCEIADKSRVFATAKISAKTVEVDIQEGSVVNSQNKVAASSNRDGAMRVYIKQREDSVATQMKPGKDGMPEKPEEAAKNSTIMLRFPIRVEYIGKLDKDPMHLAANLQLLDGTPVNPKDIECLVHRDWINITDEKFLATFKEMFKIA